MIRAVACLQIMERGTKAFVAYVRGYKEHHCKFVFQMSDLDLNHLAQTFGLLRLPVMKEVRRAASASRAAAVCAPRAAFKGVTPTCMRAVHALDVRSPLVHRAAYACSLDRGLCWTATMAGTPGRRLKC